MNKAELIQAVAAKSGLAKKDAEAAVAAVIDSITDALKAGDKVALVGFGTFAVKARAARTGKNHNRTFDRLCGLSLNRVQNGQKFRHGLIPLLPAAVAC